MGRRAIRELKQVFNYKKRIKILLLIVFMHHALNCLFEIYVHGLWSVSIIFPDLNLGKFYFSFMDFLIYTRPSRSTKQNWNLLLMQWSLVAYRNSKFGKRVFAKLLDDTGCLQFRGNHHCCTFDVLTSVLYRNTLFKSTIAFESPKNSRIRKKYYRQLHCVVQSKTCCFQTRLEWNGR